MCGIFGYFDVNRRPLTEGDLESMGRAIVYRGPDGRGYYHDAELGLALGNQRLAILDVEHGQQPIYSEDRQIVVVQNGEIFNFLELADELRELGHQFHTHCDTEVILRLYEQWGIEGISKLNGMFAIAIYDYRKGVMYLARDRVGEKPVYFMNTSGRFIFASEIKSILNVCGSTELNSEALNQFLAFNYVPPPLTLYEGIEHVMPGHYVAVTQSGVEQHCWWDLSRIQAEDRSEEEWIEKFNTILDDAVRIRLRSDVPFGAFLSGGVDSSSVVGMMSKHLPTPVKTFTIGFEDPKYDESPYAAEAAQRFATDHSSRIVAPNLLSLWPKATYHCDQPHGDVSFLPTYKVAELASEEVKMVLTGDGADELYAGYDKYKVFFTPESFATNDREFQSSYCENISLFSLAKRQTLCSKKLLGNLKSLDCTPVLQAYYQRAGHMDRVNQALFIDMMLLLPGNNLVKPDRMGMAVSIENRAPFLDYRMMELGFAMPGKLKLNAGTSKYIYKKAVTPLIGEHLAYRKKQMFTVPVGEWFKHESRQLCTELLLSDRARSRGLFESSTVESLFTNHCNGEQNNTREIRALMAVETWLRQVEENWNFRY